MTINILNLARNLCFSNRLTQGLSLICISFFMFISCNAYAKVIAKNTSDTPLAAVKTQTDEGELFLQQNKSKPGVVTLSDGLQYKIIKKGTGAKPTASDKVTVHYEGRLINGDLFDSSYKRGEPTTFPLDAVISGWTEALQLMPVGSKWELYIPAQLAYKQEGVPPVIGPNQVLVFTVELLNIAK